MLAWYRDRLVRFHRKRHTQVKDASPTAVCVGLLIGSPPSAPSGVLYEWNVQVHTLLSIGQGPVAQVSFTAFHRPGAVQTKACRFWSNLRGRNISKAMA